MRAGIVGEVRALQVFDDGSGDALFVGGLFIGFGTRFGGGCTSGHGIFGLSNLELPSLVTNVSFMVGGIVFTNILYRVIL